jgi:hypothetical protein
MDSGPSVTDWISAISTASLGALGFIIAGYQWHKTGFNPRLTSRIDATLQGIELRIENKGRAAGMIDQVDVMKSDNELVYAEYEGFKGNEFRSIALPALASMRVIIRAPVGQPFEHGVRLLVGLGGTKFKEVVPVVAAEGVGIYGLTSVLPPGTPTQDSPERVRRERAGLLRPGRRRYASGTASIHTRSKLSR